MAELAGLPIPHMDWSSSDALQALRKFKDLWQLYFSRPLKENSEKEQISFLLLWPGGEARELASNSLRNEETQHILGKIRKLCDTKK